MNRLLVKKSEAIANRRLVYFHLVASDGITPVNTEAGGQPQVSFLGGAFGDAGIDTLNLIGNGRYWAQLQSSIVAAVGTLETRYKSGNTAECPGDSVQIVTFDPYGPSSGSGAFTITVTVIDLDINPIPGVYVRYTSGINTWWAITDGDGVAVFNLDAGTYTVGMTKSGYSFGGDTTTVFASLPSTYQMDTIVVAPPGDPTLTTAYLNAYNVNNVLASGINFQVALHLGPGTSAHSYPRDARTVTSNVAGLVSVELIRSATYAMRRQKSATVWGPWVEFTTTNTSTFPIPEILGKFL